MFQWFIRFSQLAEFTELLFKLNEVNAIPEQFTILCPLVDILPPLSVDTAPLGGFILVLLITELLTDLHPGTLFELRNDQLAASVDDYNEVA